MSDEPGAAQIWPPPIPPPDLPPKLLTRGEMSLVRWRWFYTSVAPFWAGMGVVRSTEHSPRGTLLCALDAALFAGAAVRAWGLKRRLDDIERGA